MKNKTLLLALIVTCSTRISHSMSIGKIARAFFPQKAVKIFSVRKMTTSTTDPKKWWREILLNNRLYQLRKNIREEEVTIANQGREGDIFSKMNEEARLYNLVQARKRKQELEKEAFNIEMKLAEKK